MVIRFDPQSLKQSAWHEYLTRFVLGGAVSVIAGLIAEHYGPAIGGLFLAFPAIFPASATLIEKHQRERKQRAGIEHSIRGRLAAALDARGTALGTMALAAFALVAWQLLPHYNAAWILIGALLLWLVLSVALWRLRKLLAHH